MTVVDNAVYVDGRRSEDPVDLDSTYETAQHRGGLAWIGLYRPEEAEIRAVAQEFGLHDLPVQDAISAHQRPKMERYGSTLFVVLRPAWYLQREHRVEFGEVHLFIGPDFVISIRHAESPDLAAVRDRLEQTPELLRMGPEAVLYAVLDQVVDEYQPLVTALENDIDAIEDQLFRNEPSVSRRIYELSREVIRFQRATHPLPGILASLQAGFDKYDVELELRRSLRDVADHVERVVERGDAFRELLQNALTVNATLVAQEQNEEMRKLSEAGLAQSEEVKRISAWAAILFAPTLIGTVYGMNFDVMPELRWQWGYPIAVLMMVAMGAVLYWAFRRRHWL